MHYWGLHEKVGKSIRMIGDGSAALAMKLGLSQDLTAKGCVVCVVARANVILTEDQTLGMGVRSQRYSMFVVNGKVAKLNVEAPGKFEVSDGQTLLNQIKGASL
jgi:peroxiredoxin